MTYKEFKAQSEHSIVRNKVIFNFYEISDYRWLLEVSIATLSHVTEYGQKYDFIEAQTTMTSIEAYNAYKNILDGGLE